MFRHLPILLFTASFILLAVNPPVYAPPSACAGCHSEIAKTYQRSAMAQTFSTVAKAPRIEDYATANKFDHALSGRHYETFIRDGRVFQQRYQEEDARKVRAFEQEITHVIGSGRRARSYLNLSDSGELTQLPLSWYTQENQWGMSPGYDQPKHYDFSRVIDRGCLACHNAYPLGSGGKDGFAVRSVYEPPLPQGIDCQRCHGPGSLHVELAGKHAPAPSIQAAIVNPAKLSSGLQMDVCMQCHLETTSSQLPHALRRFGRGDFSFRPGEKLADHVIHFDHAPESGKQDKFEINSSGYRLRQSQCFLRSEGKLTCTTCHDPHGAEDSVRARRESCVQCHAPHKEAGRQDCAACHMPRRRAEDAVHVVMTDHKIQRITPARDQMAPLPETVEPYRGNLVSYLPSLPASADSDLYLGLALSADGADVRKGLSLLERGIATKGAQAPEEAIAGLARVLMSIGRTREAVQAYAQVVIKQPGLASLRADYAKALESGGQVALARREYERALLDSPDLPAAHLGLGRLSKDAAAAMEHFRKATRGAAVRAEALQNLGNVQASERQFAEARALLEQALAIDPDFADAENNLGRVLAAEGSLAEALQHVRRAVSLDGSYTEARYNLARLLHAAGDRRSAISEYGKVLERRADMAEAHLSLGVALAEEGQIPPAIHEFRETLRLRPGHPEAIRNLQLAQEIESTPAKSVKPRPR